jgi:hypothetical protein
MRERGIGADNLDQVLIEQVDVSAEPSNTAARKTPAASHLPAQSGGDDDAAMACGKKPRLNGAEM